MKTSNILRLALNLIIVSMMMLFIAACAMTTPAQLAHWPDSRICDLAGKNPWFAAHGDIVNARQESERRKLNCAEVMSAYYRSSEYAADMQRNRDAFNASIEMMKQSKPQPPVRPITCIDHGNGVVTCQ